MHCITYIDMETLPAESDSVSLHVPLLPGTLHLLNAQTIARKKRGVVIVNSSRGKPIDTTALIAAFKSGHLVFPNVLITAHQAFLTHETLSEIARVTTMNILAQEATSHSLKELSYDRT